MNPAPIRAFDLKMQTEGLQPELSAVLEGVLARGQFIMGPEVAELEARIATYLGVRHAIALNSGTDALVIGLRALGIKPGDEVITSAFSFFATAEAIETVGAKPVLIDIVPDTLNIDAEGVARAITSRTRAVIPVHLFGRPCPVSEIQAAVRGKGIAVLEDAAQSFGSKMARGRFCATLGDAGALSFFPTKNLGCFGDGGMLVTASDALAETARSLRSHGSLKKYHNERIGYNSRLDTLQAAVLSVKLPRLDAWLARRRRIAELYRTALSQPTLCDRILSPIDEPGHTYNQFTVRVLSGRRDALQLHLKSLGIETTVYYPLSIDQLPVFRGRFGEFPESHRAAREVLSLPMYPELADADVERTSREITRFLLDDRKGSA
jgi:dTDP-4-amino-4,6-dideoxygalactose transaminase